MAHIRQDQRNIKTHQKLIIADMRLFKDSMEDQLKKMNANQEAILESQGVQPPKYIFQDYPTDDDVIPPVDGSSSASPQTLSIHPHSPHLHQLHPKAGMAHCPQYSP